MAASCRRHDGSSSRSRRAERSTIVPDDQYADADFRAQRVKGFGGCNNYDAVYRNGGRLLLIGMPV